MELLNKIDLTSNEFQNFMDTEVKEAWIECCNSTLSGWSRHILFDNDGYSVVGPLGQGTCTMGTYNGTQLLLCKIACGNDIGDIVTPDNVEALEDFEAFKEYVLEQEYDVIDLFDLSQEEKDQKFYDLTFLDSYYCEFNRENYSNLIKEALEFDWDCFARDSITESIETSVEMLREE